MSLRLILTPVLLLLTYWINYLSSSGELGETMMNLREVFPFPYMPAGWTFSVAWTAIYLALGVWVWHIWKQKTDVSVSTERLLPRFWLSCLLNIGRIMCTAWEWYLLSVILITALMVVLRKILALVMNAPAKQTDRSHHSAKTAFGLYVGWITLATVVVGLSQFVYLMIDSNLPLTRSRTLGVIALGVLVSGILYRKYRNRAQLLIAIIGLIGVIASVVG